MQDAFAGFPSGIGLEARSGEITRHDAHAIVRDVQTGTGVALQASGSSGCKVQIVLLDDADSLALWKVTWQGRERILLSRGGLIVDGAHLRLTSTEREQLILSVFPAPAGVTSNGGKLRGRIKQPVAAAPEDQDFEKAAVWRIELPAGVDLGVGPILRLDYVGDVARVLLNGKQVTDDFYNPFTPS